MADSINLVKRALREPLLHFLIIGAALFGVYNQFAGSGQVTVDDTITISPDEVAAAESAFVERWQRPPSATELAVRIEDRIREEVFYREALKLALDQEEPVIRHCLATEFSAIAYAFEPSLLASDDVLQQHLEGHSGNYRTQPRFSFRQLYLGDVLADADLTDIQALVTRLNNSAMLPDMTDLHSQAGLQTDYADITEGQVERLFGHDFAANLAQAGVGDWQGPVTSSRGIHLLQLLEKTPARLPPLAEIRQQVEADWRTVTRARHFEGWYQDLRANYRVTVADSDA